MKKLIALFAALVMSATAVFAADGVNVTVNDVPVDVQGIIIDGRTMVPVRGVFEEMGYLVEWDADTKTAALSRGSKSVAVQADSPTMLVNGETSVELEVPAQIVDGRMMLPLRAVSEAVNAEVEWDAETKTAKIKIHVGLKIGGVLNLDELEAANAE